MSGCGEGLEGLPAEFGGVGRPHGSASPVDSGAVDVGLGDVGLGDAGLGDAGSGGALGYNAAALRGHGRAEQVSETRSSLLAEARDFEASEPEENACHYGEPVVMGTLPPEAVETSGISRSRIHADTFWIHGDSGQEPVLRAISGSGELLASYWVVEEDGTPVVMRDWEDISDGPCDAEGRGSCLYVGDVGDNNAVWDSVRVLQLEEPLTLADGDLVARTMELTYEIGPRDVEAMVVDTDATLLFITKRPGPNHVLTVPWREGSGSVASDRGVVGRETFPGFAPHMFTAADYDPALGRLIIRGYGELFDCAVDPADIGDIARWSCSAAPAGLELQGEAIAWAGGGDYVHASEAHEAPLYRVVCEDAP